MDALLDFEECVKDSPRFRSVNSSIESIDNNNVECLLEKNRDTGAGQSYSSTNQQFLSGLKELCGFYHKDGVITGCLEQFHQALSEILSFHTMLLDQTQRAIAQQLSNLCSQFVPALGDCRREFLRIGEDLDSVCVKNAQVSKATERSLRRAHTCCWPPGSANQHFALDYCLQLNCFRTQQRADILNSIFSYVQAQSTFFHQGFDLLRDLDPTVKTMKQQISRVSSECAAKRKELENTHQLVQQREEPVVFVEDLRLCAVKLLENIDRRFCFELVSVQKSCVLQADSEPLRQTWITVLQKSIDQAYRDSHTNSVSRLQPSPPAVPDPPGSSDLGSGPGKSHRPGCSSAGPGELTVLRLWSRAAEVGLGQPGSDRVHPVFRIHRSLGVHVSKVRSITLDSWDPEHLKLLCILGNDVMNDLLESRCSEEARVKPAPDASRLFQGRASAAPLPGGAGRDVVAMATALAQGSEVNAVVPEEHGRTALIGAAIGGSLLACEFLLLNGAKVNHRDLSGQGALHAAATAGHTGQVCLLLKRGANQYAADERGHDPLAIAVETANADIVTLLRMARMNEEMKDSEGLFGATALSPPPSQTLQASSDLGSGQESLHRPGVYLQARELTAATVEPSSRSWAFGQPGSDRVHPVFRDSQEFGGSRVKGQIHHVRLLGSRTSEAAVHSGKRRDERICWSLVVQKKLESNLLQTLHGRKKELWIQEKYVEKRFVRRENPGSLLACEFLLLNGAKVNHRDLSGQGALHAAATAGHTGQVCLLLKRGANQYAADERGHDPLAIAVETANADIVTLLRMARMNEEMKDSEGLFGATGDDETFQDIFRDFSDMASHEPDKLSRRKFSRDTEEDPPNHRD
ncbi:hypothetical protein WMY93_028125 [Mugilogobius chulae]|uniref:Arf-GAP with coiled-coil, ANK repeat and PH domain-containing protein n=1 Tax=Mugilogobius chulae TaxID=88201 RepID=A0AAW0MZA3_9GOBI